MATNTTNIATNTTNITNLTDAVDSLGDDSLLWNDTAGAFSAKHGTNDTDSKITNLLAGTVSSDSTDAINGSQLYGLADSFTSYLGGGADISDAGVLTGPTYTIGGTDYNNVGDALAAINTSFSTLAHHSVMPYSGMRPPRAVTVRLAPVAGQIKQPASLLMLQTVQFPLPAATLLTAHSSMTPASTLPILWGVTQKSTLTAQSPRRLMPSLAAVITTSVTRWKRSIPRWMTLCCGMQQPMMAMVHLAPVAG